MMHAGKLTQSNADKATTPTSMTPPTAVNNSIADAVTVLSLKKRRRWCKIFGRGTKTKTMTKDAHLNAAAGVRVHPPRHSRQ